ncbi:MAG: coagulation factor 5/8 type domain-containing protein [Moraxellaceae bacterium]|nr:MAG: coagulation factor 5/8 type domain-containing protein [Moraxellaceae bacterium]
MLFKPGVYDIDIPVGFFTHIMGLGAFPDQVRISSVRSEAVLPNNNATQNFWRGLENFSVSPAGGMRWGVSQAVPFRRMHVIDNNITLTTNYGWGSGGWIADSIIDKDVSAWAQQQWIARNSQWGSWSGALWNMVFVGIPNNLPGGTWPTTANTFINTTPIVREKPFLYLNGNNYEVFVPSLRVNSTGVSWANNQQAGTSIPLSQFYVARSDVDNAASINAALNAGKHLLLTPGIYPLSEAIRVTRADTIVLGIGFATLRPTNGNAVLTVDDVDGVKIAHLMVDADIKNSPVLVQIGGTNSNASHASNPTSLSDVFIRVGGNGAGKATVAMEINSNDVIVDHTWLWRADHGDGAGWYSNPSRNGLIVNGDNVTAYGLFVEHFQEYQTLWNGNNGRTYFYQSEIPYDPPTQPEYTSGPGVNGWASYKVADNVTNHEAWGLGVYAVFFQPNVYLSRAIEVPNTPGVKFHHMVTVNLTKDGGIQNVINNTGGSTSPGVATNTPRVTDYPAP